jgi:CRISPR-associated protein Cas2
MNPNERVRYMRLVLFFDLPVETAKQRKDYRLFRKFIMKDGFLPLQESVYAKLVVNDASAESAIARVRKNRPPAGLVQVLKVTENQFATMEYITGERPDYEEVDTMEELLIL